MLFSFIGKQHVFAFGEGDPYKPTLKERIENLVHKQAAKGEVNKLTAAGLTVLAGPFGFHRLYLGTDVKVPVVYTLTLGGGLGILPIADLILILVTSDLSQYQNNPRIFMWSKE